VRRTASCAIEFAKPVPLREAGSIVAPTKLRALAVALVWLLLGSVRHGISRRGRLRRSPLLSVIEVRTRDTEIVLGILIEIFRGDRVTADRGLAREADVALKDLMALPRIFILGPLLSKIWLRCGVRCCCGWNGRLPL